MTNNAPTSPFRTLGSRIAWECPWFRIRQDDVILPNGSPGVYNTVLHPGAVWIVPLTTEGEIVLIHQFRYAVNDWCWELPAGALLPGRSPLESAQIELQEEIGGVAQEWQGVGWFYCSNGTTNEKAWVFVARGVEMGETAHEPAEVMTVHRRPVAEAVAMARNGQMTDGPSALALLLSEKFL